MRSESFSFPVVPLRAALVMFCLAVAALGARAQQAAPVQARQTLRQVPAPGPALRDLIREQRMLADKAPDEHHASAASEPRGALRPVADDAKAETLLNAGAMDSRLSNEERRLLRDQVRDAHKEAKPPGTHARPRSDS